MHNMLGHSCIDLAGQFNETCMLTVFTSLPCEIKWIDWNTMSAQSGTRIKWHEPKRLGLGCFDYFPDVNPHGGINPLELINQGNIDASENILEKLCSFTHATRRDRHKRIDRFSVKRFRAVEAGWSISSYYFGNRFDLALFISWIFPFR